MIFIKTISRLIYRKITHLTASNRGQLRRVPKSVLIATYFLNISVLIQGIADVGLKFLGMLSVLPEMPWRTDFLSLTVISVVMGFRAFKAMRQLKFDVTRNSLELGFIVETALVIGDVEFIYKNIDTLPHILALRLPFIIFTLINICIIMYSHKILELRQWPHLRGYTKRSTKNISTT